MRAATITITSLTTVALFTVLSTFTTANAATAKRKEPVKAASPMSSAEEFKKHACLIGGQPEGIILLVMEDAPEAVKSQYTKKWLTPQRTSYVLKNLANCHDGQSEAPGKRILLSQTRDGLAPHWT
jgi:hypothetical protein